LFTDLCSNPERARAMRRAARRTAEMYRWPAIVERVLLPRLGLLAGPSDTAAPRPRIVALPRLKEDSADVAPPLRAPSRTRRVAGRSG
jgi:hypothetical protein